MAKFCIYCGKEVEENDNVCGNCGKTINNNAQNIVIKKKKNNSENFGIVGLCLSFSLSLFLNFTQFALKQLSDYVSFEMFVIMFFCCVIMLIAGLTFSIIGIIRCKKSDKKISWISIVSLIFNLRNILLCMLITYVFSFLVQIKN